MQPRDGAGSAGYLHYHADYNTGTNTIYAGGERESYLLPVIPAVIHSIHRPSRSKAERLSCPHGPAPMNHDTYPDSYIRGILNTVKTIAMVGISPKDNRPSYFAFKYLHERGYRMIPVNPGQAGQKFWARKSTPSSPTSPSRSTWSIFSAPPNTCCRSCRRR